VTKQAHDRKLSVGYLPLVLLRTGTVEHWRGDIQPTQRWLWYRNYNRYIGRWADMARDLGVPLLSVGTEYSSLEKDTTAWRTIIANVRARYDGRLTYSANWDHLDVPLFWNDLDVVGMTGYHSLTTKNDPTVDEIVAAWAPIREKLMAAQARENKPILFTEIGYASQDGTNRDPWDYFRYLHDLDKDGRQKPPDHGEQADCFAALFKVWGDAPQGFMGMYIWNWWRHEDPKTDYGYSVYGKPAYAVIKKYFADLKEHEPPPSSTSRPSDGK
jgi:hypothetical protein